MITFEQMLEACGSDVIRGLDVGCFGAGDIVNIILQRSEIIRDQRRPGKVVGAWVEGDAGPALALVDRMGEDLVRRAAAIIWLEYLELKPSLDAIRPKSAADIGCGYAIFDLFLWRDFPGRLLLIDLETSDDRHFGFQQKGAAYSNLTVARRFLEENGVRGADIHCVNPRTDRLADHAPVDLAVSFISCGFHYPCATYADFFRTGVSDRGGVILDLRARKAAAELGVLGTLGTTSQITDAAYGNARRVLLRKAPAQARD